MEASETLNQPEEFVIRRDFAWIMRICTCSFTLMVLFCLAVPFLPDSSDPDVLNRSSRFVSTCIMSCIGVLLFGSLAWYCYHVLRCLPFYAVMADDDGVWPAHLPKEEALVRWQDIAGVWDRPFMGRVDLLNEHGDVLLKLEQQLVGLEKLRIFVAAE